MKIEIFNFLYQKRNVGYLYKISETFRQRKLKLYINKLLLQYLTIFLQNRSKLFNRNLDLPLPLMPKVSRMRSKFTHISTYSDTVLVSNLRINRLQLSMFKPKSN